MATTPLSDAKRLARLALPRGPIRAVVDTDTYNEIDDQFALTHLLLSPAQVRLEAIYAAPFQNIRAATPAEGMALSHDEILRLLARLGRDPRGLVHRGVTEFVGPQKIVRQAPAVSDLIARARAAPDDDPLYVIAIAAISTVASALLAAPDIADKIVVIWLGGHALHWPDLNEFNLIQDVGGAQVLFDSGVPLILIPCRGVASHLVSSLPESAAHVAPQGAIGAFLAQRFAEYGAGKPAGWSKVIWDLAASGWAVCPDWCESVLIPTPIVTDNATWSIDPRRPLMRYVTALDRNAIFGDLYAKLADHAGAAAEV